MRVDSPASRQQIFLILCPLIAAGLLFFMPLGWMFTIAAFCAGLFLLVANRRMSALIKGTVACLWVLGLGLMMYVLTAFTALVEAAITH
ncbi:hypothetical protein [Schaalia sp. Marseille-Q2122]|uniref:hypothetical protein n=1 Tax=Schaalia sp. Marseille-Q2122 TaxID=2736604 RepID=UPI0015889098|nr:hypothetical protein [Schaalia sp. Marseille-Q2122]